MRVGREGSHGMQPRDLFDVVLVVLVAVALYHQFYGLTNARGLTAIQEAFQAINPVYYLVVGGIFGILFVSYIAIYLPNKHSQDSS